MLGEGPQPFPFSQALGWARALQEGLALALGGALHLHGILKNNPPRQDIGYVVDEETEVQRN